jgi:DNA-binding NarL/FixJ family response regulator
MPFEKTKEALDRICAVEPSPQVMIVTMFEDPTPIRTFLRLGISGCVLKSALSRQLVGEVRPAVLSTSRPPLIDGLRRRVFDQVDNRMHARKAQLYLLLG